MTDYAQLALSLKDNEAFQAALDARRSAAVDTLVSVKRDNESAFYLAQATVAVVDDIRADLDQFIREGTPKKQPGIA